MTERQLGGDPIDPMTVPWDQLPELLPDLDTLRDRFLVGGSLLEVALDQFRTAMVEAIHWAEWTKHPASEDDLGWIKHFVYEAALYGHITIAVLIQEVARAMAEIESDAKACAKHRD